MSATIFPPDPRCDEASERIACASPDEFERIRSENEHLRELVVQLSRLVVQNAITRKR